VFTIADAIKQCANNTIARSAANPTSNYRNYVVDEKTYVNLWASLCLFLRSHNSHKPNHSVLTPNQHYVPTPVNIIGIGVASHRTFNLGIKIPVFDISQKFAVKYDLVQPKTISNGRPAPSSTLKIGAKVRCCAVFCVLLRCALCAVRLPPSWIDIPRSNRADPRSLALASTVSLDTIGFD
jgi:hypothetical protein